MPVFEQIDAIFRAPDMSHDLAFALGVIAGRDPDLELAAMIGRVEGKFESSRNYPVVLQFIQEFSRLRDREVIRLFEFIYSSMVNRFKGELGEVLARPSLLAFQRLLPMATELTLGADITSRQLRRNKGWYPAADALYCVRDDRGIEIVAIAEIKSKSTPFEEMRQQVTGNLIRLRRGLRVEGVEIPPERIRLRTRSEAVVPIAEVDEEVARSVETLMVVPFRAATSEVPWPHPRDPALWLAELPWPQDDITEAAYRMMSWYFSRLGPKVFHHRAHPPHVPDGRIPVAHEELSLEENGRHAFLEAIYHTTGRKHFNPHEVPERGRRTPWQTLLWLYNSLGFGYAKATADELEFEPFTPSDESEARRKRRDAAVDAFRAGRFDEALGMLPDPAEQKDAWWSRREWVMLARIHARTGDVPSANAALSRAEARPPVNSLALPIELAGVRALIALASGDEASARAAIASAHMILEDVRACVRQHEEEGWELPSRIEPNSAREGVIDLAVAHAALGECAAALTLLRRLRQLRGWELEHFANDPLLARCTAEAGILDELRECTGRKDGLAIF